ncbi:type II toxin-antitoxin system VapC family toxin [Pseudacidovorax sp. RU35E]|uniref:type II toxin-antitoxin system tRNA(fMet)-specific endonuclease VapC n=1 Tax=Pseudacidovorax sp. RU35E TaxID=1907403 RepID=UPI0009570889|nr:type II toxin-antitoxin system VapC family toxin [Pseudacidovorax sp. RU35E]SIQ74887.1 tRNA(fMet)-specific endonuclease VapC [Pseudacidovorax sp. RU35E]
MAARFMLDTNICIYIQRQRPPEVLARFSRLKAGEAVVSLITWGELLFGAHKSQRSSQALAALDEFASLIPVLPMHEQAGRHYGSIRAALEAKGQPIGGNDLWIAAHAKAEGLTLVTNNEREFLRVPALKVQNWAA